MSKETIPDSDKYYIESSEIVIVLLCSLHQ